MIKLAKEGAPVLCITGQTPPPAERFVLTSDGAKLEALTPYFESGAVKVIVDKVFPFSEGKDAFAYLETGRARGKVVIKVTS